MVGRKKKAIFSYLRDRVWQKVQGWTGKHLSKAGREVLIKSVAQAIPSYCMSTFLIPTSLGEEMERMMNSFWWGSNRAHGRGINWMRWEKLAMRKEYGGMGFRHLHTFNLAMLGKQGWKILTNPDAIISRVFKAKYFPRGDFLGASIGHNPSFVWRSICASRAIVNGGLRWKIGDGSRVRIWDDPWLRGKQNPYVISGRHANNNNELHYVSDIIDPNTNDWRVGIIQETFSVHDAHAILRMPRKAAIGDDALVWEYSRNGIYSVKSGYYYAMEHLRNNSHLRVEGNWSALWSLKVPNKLKILIWRIVRGCLPTRERLLAKRVNCPSLCPI